MENNKYRFTGYQLPMIHLDLNGPSYAVGAPHPYVFNQPQYWQKQVYYGHPSSNMNSTETSDKLFPFLQNAENV